MITVDAKEFAMAVGKVAAVLVKKNSEHVRAKLHLTENLLNVYASYENVDGVVYLNSSVACETNDNITAYCSLDELSKLAKKFKSGSLSIYETEISINFIYDGAEYQVTNSDEPDYFYLNDELVFESVADLNAVDSQIISTAVMPVIPENGGRRSIECLYMVSDGESFDIVALDGFRIHKYSQQRQLSQFKIAVPNMFTDAVKKMFSKSPFTISVVGEKLVHFQNGNDWLTCTNNAATYHYPDYNSVLNSMMERVKTKLDFYASDLVGALKHMPGDNKSTLVKFNVNDSAVNLELLDDNGAVQKTGIELMADVAGDDAVITLNQKYLNDALSGCDLDVLMNIAPLTSVIVCERYGQYPATFTSGVMAVVIRNN